MRRTSALLAAALLVPGAAIGMPAASAAGAEPTPDTAPPVVRCSTSMGILDAGAAALRHSVTVRADDPSGVAEVSMADPALALVDPVVRDTWWQGRTIVTIPQGARHGYVSTEVDATDRVGNHGRAGCAIALVTSRLGGQDRPSVAGAASRLETAPVRTVYVTSDDDLTAASAAATALDADGGLLYAHRDAVPEATTLALARLRPERIVAVGDLSSGVVDALREHAPVERRTGWDPSRLSATVAVQGWRGAGRPAVGTVHVVADGDVSATVAAAASRAAGTPVLVSRRLPSTPTLDALGALRPRRVVLVGTGWTSTAVSSVSRRTGADVVVQPGSDAVTPAAALAPRPAAPTAFVAGAGEWGDVLVAASHADGRTVYLATPNGLPAATAALARSDGPQTGVVAVGSPVSVSNEVQQATYDAATAG